MDLLGTNPVSGRTTGLTKTVRRALRAMRGSGVPYSVIGATALAVRGLPLALVLMMRVLVAAFGIAAGLALLGRRAGAVTMAKVSLAASAATDVFVHTTPFFPNNRPPGDTALVVVASLTYYGAWMVYLFRSKRVKETFST